MEHVFKEMYSTRNHMEKESKRVKDINLKEHMRKARKRKVPSLGIYKNKSLIFTKELLKMNYLTERVDFITEKDITKDSSKMVLKRDKVLLHSQTAADMKGSFPTTYSMGGAKSSAQETK